MKLVIISFDEPFFIPLLFKPLLKSYPNLIEAVIIVPQILDGSGFLKYVKNQLSLMGPWGVTSKILEYLFLKVETFIGIADNSLSQYAKKRQIRVFTTKGVNDKKTIEILKKIKPSYVIAQVPQKIKPEILILAKKGFINKHASLLPQYRGLYPVFWALLNNEKQMGFTFHLMDQKIDAGKILLQTKISVKNGDSVYSLYKRIFTQAGESLVKLVSDLDEKQITPKNMKNGGSYYSHPTKQDIKKLVDKGIRFV